MSKISDQEIVDLRLKFSDLYGNLTDKFKGSKFVVSGVFESLSRNELKKLIEDNGGKISSSISSKTNYIVAGDNIGPSKKAKAETLNIPIISEQDFLQMISQGFISSAFHR